MLISLCVQMFPHQFSRIATISSLCDCVVVFARPDLGESSLALVDAQEESVEVLQLDGNFERQRIPGNTCNQLRHCMFLANGHPYK